MFILCRDDDYYSAPLLELDVDEEKKKRGFSRKGSKRKAEQKQIDRMYSDPYQGQISIWFCWSQDYFLLRSARKNWN